MESCGVWLLVAGGPWPSIRFSRFVCGVAHVSTLSWYPRHSCSCRDDPSVLHPKSWWLFWKVLLWIFCVGFLETVSRPRSGEDRAGSPDSTAFWGDDFPLKAHAAPACTGRLVTASFDRQHPGAVKCCVIVVLIRMHSLAICVLSLRNVIQIVHPSSNCIIFLLLSSECFFINVNAGPSPDVLLLNICSHPVGCLFTFFVVSFKLQKVWNLIKSSLLSFSFVVYAVGALFEKFLPNPA